MRKHLLLLFALIFVAIAGFSSPKIKFDNIKIDLGAIKEADGLAKFQYIYKNIGNDTLRIKTIKAGCSCTKIAWSAGKLAFNESGSIEGFFDPSNLKGTIHRNITVVSNDPERPVVVLILKAIVIPKKKDKYEKYVYKNGNLRTNKAGFYFGEISEKETTNNQTLVVFNDSDKEIELKRIEPLPYAEFFFSKTKIQPNKTETINCVLDLKKVEQYGLHYNVIKLETSDSENPNKNYMISLIKLPELANKDSLAPIAKISNKVKDFGNVFSSTAQTFTTNIYNKGKTPLKIYAVETSCSCVNTTLSLKELLPGQWTPLVITYHPQKGYGQDKQRINIYSNDPNWPIHSIEINANVTD